MDLLDDPMFKTKYQKHKVRVKLWESDFMEKYGRKPNKNDIREADTIIREAYKIYWKLKTRALEETLIDITFSDDVQTNVSASSSSALTLKETDEKKKDDVEIVSQDAENVDPDICKDVKETDYKAESTSESLNVDGVWGVHLNKCNELNKKKKNLSIDRSSSSFQLSRKMFTSVTFAKRNPRKSLSLTKIKSKSDLNPTVTTNVTMDQVKTQNENGIETTNIVESVIGDTLKVVHPQSKVIGQSISAVQQLIEGRIVTTGRNLNQGWLERCSKENGPNYVLFNSQRLSNTNDSGVESMESSMYSPNKQMLMISSEKSLELFDEEDFIYNSDSEEDRKNKRVRNIRKTLSGGECYTAKRPRLETQSHLSSSQPISTATSSHFDYSVTRVSNVEFTKRNDDSNVTLIKGNCENLPSSKLVHDTCDIKINMNKNNKADDIKNVNDQDAKAENHEKSTIVQIQSSVSSNKYEANTETSETEQATVSKVHKKVKRNNISTSNFDRENSDSEDEQIKTRKVKRAPRKLKESSSTKKAKKPAKVQTSHTTNKGKKASTRKRKNEVKDLNEDIEPEVTDVSEIPIYGVESLDVIPRFVLSKTGAGDLVTDFSKVVSTLDNQFGNIADTVKPKTNLTDKEKLELKVASGKLNDNFVRINIKKKIFVRGKKSMNFSKYKKNQWKQRKKELASSEGSLDLADLSEKNGLMCFKCGNVGHFAKNCKAMKCNELLPLDDIDESSEYPTLEEVEKMASESALINHNNRLNRLPERPNTSYLMKSELSQPTEQEENIDDILLEGVNASEFFDDKIDQTPTGYKIPKDLVAKLLPPKVGPVKPLYSVGPDGSLPETSDEVFKALRKFGHESFRPGQEKAVMRILSGQSTLVTLSTGAGKSLCYQLPAYLYAKHSSCITLVISPLVSLMDDQVTDVPTFLSAACLHTNQTPKQRQIVMDMVKQGELNILLVSPEAVVAGEKSTGFGALLRQLPPIAFACIDEAHCISQWSHNFRPSYLMVSRVLKEKLNVKTILGLTATATKNTAESIVQHLDIHDGLAGIISNSPLPDNLMLTISKDKQKDRALIELLQSARFERCDSIIIYCTRREECVRVAELLRAALQDPRNHKKISNVAEVYHAGLPSYRRKSVQKAFMRNEIRIVVATIAFGMGINKPDIRSVIHYNMPSSFERYVQEVGRAGRDGLPAQCHLFLDFDKNDKNELQRHIYANGVDRHTIRRLLQKIFVPCSCTKVNDSIRKERCPGHEVALPVDETVQALDISQEMISTLLCYLELHPKRYITVLSSVYTMAKVISYKGPTALKAAAQNSPPLAMAIALDIKKGIFDDASSVIEFPVVDIASYIGWDSGVTKSHLKNLEWRTDNGTSKRSAISVRYESLGLRVKAPGDLTNTELDEALDELAKQSQLQEISGLKQLEAIYIALNKSCALSIKQCLNLDDDCIRKSDELKTIIRTYFQSDNPLNDIELELENKLENEAQIASDIRSMILSYRDTSFTGRTVARIFHGIQSPNYSALVWCRSRFWRAHLAANFNSICQIATKEILAMR